MADQTNGPLDPRNSTGEPTDLQAAEAPECKQSVANEKGGASVLRTVLASGALALFVALTIAYLGVAGLIHMATARIILFLAWCVGSGSIIISEPVWGQRMKHKTLIGAGAAMLLGVALIVLDTWTVHHLPPSALTETRVRSLFEQVFLAHNAPSSTMANPPTPYPASLAKVDPVATKSSNKEPKNSEAAKVIHSPDQSKYPMAEMSRDFIPCDNALRFEQNGSAEYSSGPRFRQVIKLYPREFSGSVSPFVLLHSTGNISQGIGLGVQESATSFDPRETGISLPSGETGVIISSTVS
jgi:hypothetical protein